MRFLITLIALGFSMHTFAQNAGDYQGKVVDKETKEALGYATVSFLFPEDSTLAFFGITDVDGFFKIQKVKPGKYLMQVAFLGYNTLYRDIDTETAPPVLGEIGLEAKSVELQEATVTGEAVPIVMKKDTVEYNSAAFRTNPDDDVEGLLKKMPGIEVDREGNVKAHGEDVQKVLVDGKEFFGDDPKVATKNLPADAIDKVQVFDKKSDAAEFTGIDDGQRSKTINLLLKDGKKSGYFGEVEGGYGSSDTYKGRASINRFTKKTQLSALGRLNNINEYGFSINDYLNFQGGLANLMSGGGMMTIRSNGNDIPLNTGQAQNGLLTSGAGGLNFNLSQRKDNQLNMNYMMNYSERDLEQTSSTTNFLQDRSFDQAEELDRLSKNEGHRVNIYWKNDLDTLNRVVLRASGSYSEANTNENTMQESFNQDGTFANGLNRDLTDLSDGYNGNANFDWIHKSGVKRGRVLQTEVDVSREESNQETGWDSETRFGDSDPVELKQLRTDRVMQTIGSGGVSWNEPLGRGHYVELDVNATGQLDEFNRVQVANPGDEEVLIPQLSPIFERELIYAQPELSFKRIRDESTFRVGLSVHNGESKVKTSIGDSLLSADKTPFYLLPQLSWRKEFGRARHLRVRLNSNVNYPSASQLVQAPDNSDQINQRLGNVNLKPEIRNTASTSVMIYDQFSFTSFFGYISATRTADKITYERTVDSQTFNQVIKPINYKDEWSMNGSLSFSTPIRALEIEPRIRYSPSISWGYNLVNDIENQVQNVNHNISLTIHNRKDKVVSADVGGSISFTNTKYSVQDQLNQDYYNWSLFADVEVFLSKRWNLNTSMDYTNYNNQSFDENIVVPLWSAELSHYFMAANRATISVKAFDILNQYTGIERFSNQNLIGETRSNIIGQYVMLNFKYKLNKLGAESQGGLDIKMHRRRR